MSAHEILFERHGALAEITLHRPRALNALTLGMIRELSPRLRDWAEDPSVAAVLIKGAGDRAFCAGGDLRAFWDSRHGRRRQAGGFFREEYRLNRQVFRFPKPYIAIIDGIVMGGGVGLSVHGRYRVASERTRFAMPETGIGLFPDVGGSYFLPRLPGELGLYLGLTGHRLDAADCLYCGIATHYVEAAALPVLEAALSQALGTGCASAAAADLLDRMSADPGPSALAADREAIDRCFAQESVEAILTALEAEGSDWAAHTLKRLHACSPTSLKLTFRQIRTGAELDFDAAMVMEFRLSQACLAGHDFLEGVRAVVIDKDMAPVWDPASLADVNEAAVAASFEAQQLPDLTFEEPGDRAAAKETKR
jgi:enoyl-CoA hydratase